MKNDFLITFRSVTFAQRGQRILQQLQIPCELHRTPKLLSERGCGYCLRLRERYGEAAARALRGSAVPYGKVYFWENGERFREWCV